MNRHHLPKAYVGTSGWHYAHWHGPFYPTSVHNDEMLAYYCQHLSTVEVNNSFYRLPNPKVMQDWYNTVPQDFTFAVKASRYITHLKRLTDPQESIKRFFKAIAPLGEKTGPILFQLPPNFKCDCERLVAFLKALPKDYTYTFEFREPSWLTQSVYDVLEDYQAAFCIFELAGNQTPLVTTGKTVYIRLHGPGEKKYQGNYIDSQLKGWLNRIQDWQQTGKTVYCYFDNDQNGYAAQNAITLQQLMSQSKLQPAS